MVRLNNRVVNWWFLTVLWSKQQETEERSTLLEKYCREGPWSTDKSGINYSVITVVFHNRLLHSPLVLTTNINPVQVKQNHTNSHQVDCLVVKLQWVLTDSSRRVRHGEPVEPHRHISDEPCEVKSLFCSRLRCWSLVGLLSRFSSSRDRRSVGPFALCSNALANNRCFAGPGFHT